MQKWRWCSPITRFNKPSKPVRNKLTGAGRTADLGDLDFTFEIAADGLKRVPDFFQAMLELRELGLLHLVAFFDLRENLFRSVDVTDVPFRHRMPVGLHEIQPKDHSFG